MIFNGLVDNAGITLINEEFGQTLAVFIFQYIVCILPLTIHLYVQRSVLSLSI